MKCIWKFNSTTAKVVTRNQYQSKKVFVCRVERVVNNMNRIIDEKTAETVNICLGQAEVHIKMAIRALEKKEFFKAADTLREAYIVINAIDAL